MIKIPSDKKINWIQLIMIFILGILIAANGFLLLDNMGLHKEIEKLKNDDLSLAQAVNTILSQIQQSISQTQNPY